MTRAVIDAVGAERTAIRLAPFTTFLDAIDDDPVALGTYMTDQARRLDRRAALQAVGCCRGHLPEASEAFEWAPEGQCLPSDKLA